MPDKEVPILTRELIYTAVTRAEKRVMLCARPEILLKSLQTPTVRFSGLPDRLKEEKES